MEHIYSPWRMQYFDRDKSLVECAFCEAFKRSDGPDNLIVHRGKTAFVILNLFPYTSGHLMVVPFEHSDTLEMLPAETQAEMMALTAKAITVLKAVYHPQGFNVGINLGVAAGAGIAEHLHMHVVPRWGGDANFISVIGETRVLPEAIQDTYCRLREGWQA
ncbi:MAG: HIT domain-containing protein [Anaerolineaceae bacterium]